MHDLGQKLAENIQAKNLQEALDQAALRLIECRKAVKRMFDDAKSYFENTIIKGDVPLPFEIVDRPEMHSVCECLNLNSWPITTTEVPVDNEHRLEWDELVVWSTDHNLRVFLTTENGSWFVNVSPLVI